MALVETAANALGDAAITRGGTLPAAAMRVVAPNDGADLPDGPCRALNVATAGTASVVDMTGTTTTIHLMQGWNPVAVRRIRATGTAAAGIVACY